ncbi:rhomboid-like protein 15 isoform X2 [Aegilops tauschii subsp. strangulata]|nr:rhomboid-like protein 15 isoform X2 [Aegilops tauschii subsp. strangulata]
MSPNIITEAGVSTRLNQWWSSTPFITSGVTIICAAIYLVCLLVGYDSYAEICFLPSAVASHFQVYRFYTSVLFHGSLLHVLFNMLTFVPLGTELERIMGSVRLLFLMFLLATTNAIFHLIVAFLVDYNPLYHVSYLVDECSIGFSGVIFSMIVIETSLSGVQYRSVFGLFNVPAKWYSFYAPVEFLPYSLLCLIIQQYLYLCIVRYAWILLILFQFLASNVSLLGHLSGILSGFAYTYGLFNYLLPGPSFYSSIEGLSMLSVCVRRPGFILCTGGTTYGQLPTHSNMSTPPSALINANFLRNISSWMPSRRTSTVQTSTNQEQEDPRFPGRGRTLASTGTEPTAREANANLHARHTAANTVRADATVTADQTDTFDEELKKLVGMGFERTQAEVALAAADGDPNVAIEILMSQQD